MEKTKGYQVDTLKLRITMAEKDLRIKDLSRLAGVSIPTVNKARNGKSIRESNIVKIAKALNLNPLDLIREEIKNE